MASLDLIERMDRLPITPMHKKIWKICFIAWFFDGYIQALPSFIGATAFTSLSLNVTTALYVVLFAPAVGNIIGNYSLSFVADWLGRRRVFQADMLIYSLGMLVSIFSTNWWELFICLVVAGIGVSGLYTVDNAYISEYFPPKQRGKWQSSMVVSLVPATMLVPLLALSTVYLPAWIGWRIIPILAVIPAFLAFSVRRNLPESVRFLISRNRKEEAARIVETLEASAGPEFKYDGPLLAPQVSRKAKPRPQILLQRKYLKYTVIFSLGWFLPTLFGVANFLPVIFTQGLGGGAVGLQLTVIVAEMNNVGTLISRLFSTFTMDRYGRKFNMVVGLAIAGISALLWAYPFTHRTTVPFLYLILPGMGTTFYNSWFMGFAVSATEIYPVEARSMSYGFINGWLRWSALLNTFVVGALITNQAYLFYAYATVAAFLVVLHLVWIPETKGRNLEISSGETAYTTQEGAREASGPASSSPSS